MKGRGGGGWCTSQVLKGGGGGGWCTSQVLKGGGGGLIHLTGTVKLLIIGDDLFGKIDELKTFAKFSRPVLIHIPVLEIDKLILCHIWKSAKYNTSNRQIFSLYCMNWPIFMFALIRVWAKPVFKWHVDDGTPCDQALLSQKTGFYLNHVEESAIKGPSNVQQGSLWGDIWGYCPIFLPISSKWSKGDFNLPPHCSLRPHWKRYVGIFFNAKWQFSMILSPTHSLPHLIHVYDAGQTSHIPYRTTKPNIT